MRIFVGFGYNPDDEWIKELVFPLLESFDVDIITGEDIHGQVLSDGVKERIKNCDAVLAFRTRRDLLGNGKYTSHDWVRDELVIALGFGIKAVEIRDILVEGQGGGIVGDRQRIEFDLGAKDKLLVEIAKCISNLKREKKSTRIQLLPSDDIVKEVRPLLKHDKITCKYRYMDGSRQTVEYSAKPFPLGRGLCLDVSNLPSENALIEIKIEAPDFSWTSAYESVQILSINLQKD